MADMSRAVREIAPVALAIVSVAVVIGTGAIVLGELGTLDVVTNSTTADNTIQSGEDALGTFGDFLVPLAVVAVASIIFLLLGGMQAVGSRSMR